MKKWKNEKMINFTFLNKNNFNFEEFSIINNKFLTIFICIYKKRILNQYIKIKMNDDDYVNPFDLYE